MNAKKSSKSGKKKCQKPPFWAVEAINYKDIFFGCCDSVMPYCFDNSDWDCNKEDKLCRRYRPFCSSQCGR